MSRPETGAAGVGRSPRDGAVEPGDGAPRTPRPTASDDAPARPPLRASPDDAPARPPLLTAPDDALAAARAYAAAIAPDAADRDRAGAVPREELAALDRSGLLSITVPARDGGAGLGPAVLADVVRTIAAVDPAIAQVPQSHYLFVDVLAAHGTDEQRARILGDVLAGRRLGNALAERGTKHAQDLRTRLVREGDGLRLRGTKHYCTGAITSAWIPVSALDDDGRLVVAIVPRDAPGVDVDEDWNVMGQRATVSGTTTLDDVAVDPGLVVPYWRAFEGPQALGSRAQLVHAAIEVGIARGALDDAADYLRTRSRPSAEATRAGYGERAGDDPHTLLRLGRLATQVTAAEQTLRWAAEQLEAVGLEPADDDAAAHGSLAVAQAKAFGSETAVLVASDLFALCGTSATDRRHDLDRHWRNARTHSVHDPVDWKYHHLGARIVHGTLPPRHGQL